MMYYKEIKEGVLVYDEESERMDVRLGLNKYYGGLNCGNCFEVLIDDEWIETCIELGTDWYLVGVDAKGSNRLVGLRVRGEF